MFLHLGVDTVVPLSSIIGIFDIRIIDSDIIDNYIKNMRKSKKNAIIDISENDAKSFIITEKSIYFSAISSPTLEKRAKQKIPGGQ